MIRSIKRLLLTRDGNRWKQRKGCRVVKSSIKRPQRRENCLLLSINGREFSQAQSGWR